MGSTIHPTARKVTQDRALDAFPVGSRCKTVSVTPFATARNLEIEALYIQGVSTVAIGQQYGLTHQAVGLVLRRVGVQGAVRLERLGVTSEVRDAALKDGSLRRFQQQRAQAGKRGIGWHLTFAEWLRVWQDSGHLSERGCSGYCMSRRGDSGPYAVGNVFVQTHAQNSRDASCQEGRK